MYCSSHASAAACRSKIASRLRATLAASVSRWNIRNVRPLRSAVSTENLPGGEREQIGRDRLRFGEADRASGRPCASRATSAPLASASQPVGNVERQRPARLQVRLVEAGKRQVRARRHEDRVEEIVVAVERGVAGVEVERQAVLAGKQRFRRHDDVTVDLTDGDRLAAAADRAKQPGAIGREVERQRRFRIAERERRGDRAGNRLLPVGWDRERHVVADVRHAMCALARQTLADARIRIR